MKIKPTSEKAKSASKVSSRSHLGERVPRLRFLGFEGEWEVARIGELYSERSQRCTTPMELLSVTISEGVVPKADIEGKDNSSEDKSNYKVVHVGDMVYNTMRMWQGASGLSAYNGIVSPAYTILKDAAKFDHEFMASLFKTEWLINEFRKNSQGLTSDTWNLKYPQIAAIKVRLPSVQEQHHIATFLSLIDSRITAQRKIVELLKKHKRGLHSAIFGQKCRVVNADGKPWPAWRQVRIGDIFQERSERGGTADELLSVTINNGVKRQADTDKKDSSSEDKSNYKKVLPGDIVYNTMRMWQGASGVSPWAGIVSPAYTVIYPRGRQNTTFWAYAFKYWRLIQEFQKFSQGLTSDTWNLKYPQLSDIRVYEPSMDEQEVIVNILSMLDERVSATEQELNKMRNLKSGLLQQLFV